MSKVAGVRRGIGFRGGLRESGNMMDFFASKGSVFVLLRRWYWYIVRNGALVLQVIKKFGHFYYVCKYLDYQCKSILMI